MQINFDIELKKWQEDAMLMFERYQHDICVIKAKRQVGKSFLITLYCIKYALEHKRASIFFLSVSFKQCSKVMSEMKDAIEGAPFVKRIDNAKMAIEFTNGSAVNFISAEQTEDRLQGFTANLLIVDEHAYIPDNIFFTCLPYCNATKGQVICVSTPRFKDGAFYNLFTDGNNPDIKDVHSLDVCNYDTSDMLSPSRLEYYRKTLPKIKYQMFYMGEFVSADGEVFSDFADCIKTPTAEDFNDPVTIGVDWSAATGNDSTVFTAITENNVVLEVMGFNDKGSTEAIDELVRFADKFNTKKILVEKNSLGEVYHDLLKRKVKSIARLWQIEAFVTTNDSKSKQVDNLQVLFQNKAITIPNNEQLIHQLSSYERTVSKTGKSVYNAPSGQHDDYCISLMLATWAVRKTGKKTIFI